MHPSNVKNNIGSIEEVVRLLVDTPHREVVSPATQSLYLQYGEAPKYEALMTEFREVADEMGLRGRHRDDLLCKYQRRAFQAGYRPYEVDTNIRGWCYGCQMQANLTGGRFSQCPAGTLEDALRAAFSRLATQPEATLRVRVAHLPEAVQQALKPYLAVGC